MRYLNKIEKYIFFTFLFAIPIHTRKILWQKSWFFNEWESIFLYGTDILIVILLIFWLINGKKYPILIDKYDYFLFLFALISFGSAYFAVDSKIAWYQLLKLAEFYLLYFYLKSCALRKFPFIFSLTAVLAGGIFQALIVFLQYLKQGSLGLKYLGESLLLKDLQGVAVFINSGGDKILRGYGTTPHPNVVGAYIFLAIFALYFIWIYGKKNNWFGVAAYSFLMAGLFLTFSRTLAALFFLGFLIRFLVTNIIPRFRNKYLEKDRQYRKIFVLIFVVTVVTTSAFSYLLWPEVSSRINISGTEEVVQLRVFYARQTLDRDFSWVGVGIGNHIPWLRQTLPALPRNAYQPVHNIYLLILNETGILGLMSFLLFMFFLIVDFVRRNMMSHLYHFSFLILFASFLLMGLTDHFLWSLQEGKLLLWVMIALMTDKHTLDNI